MINPSVKSDYSKSSLTELPIFGKIKFIKTDIFYLLIR